MSQNFIRNCDKNEANSKCIKLKKQEKKYLCIFNCLRYIKVRQDLLQIVATIISIYFKL